MLITVTIDYRNHDRRLDHWLATFYTHTPISHIQKLIRKGYIRINGTKAVAASRIYDGDIIALPKPDIAPTSTYVAKKKSQLHNAIVYENEHYIIVDKPPYVPVHRGSGHDTSLIDDLEEHYGTKLYLVHRLDRLTSGVMVIAKHPSMQNTLTKMFKERSIHKTYHCVVRHWRHGDTLRVDEPLLRVRHNFIDTSIVHPDGKESTSIFNVLHTEGPYTLLHVKLITGRMHQIRSHLMHLNTPIIGDELYKNTHNVSTSPGLMLLSYQLSFDDGSPQTFYGQWPEDKKAWLLHNGLILHNITG